MGYRTQTYVLVLCTGNGDSLTVSTIRYVPGNPFCVPGLCTSTILYPGSLRVKDIIFNIQYTIDRAGCDNESFRLIKLDADASKTPGQASGSGDEPKTCEDSQPTIVIRPISLYLTTHLKN